MNCFLASFYGVIGFGAQLVWVQCISAGALMLVLTNVIDCWICLR